MADEAEVRLNRTCSATGKPHQLMILNRGSEITRPCLDRRPQLGLVFKAHRLLCHSTLGLRVLKKNKKKTVMKLLNFDRRREKFWGGG